MSANPEALVRVAAHPEDPDVRLAYAQLLPAQQAPRAEFIRAQVLLAGRGLDPERRMELRQRVDTLRVEHEAGWTRRLRELGASDFQLTRGFVEEVGLSEKALAEHGAELLLLEPVHRLRVKLGDGQGLARAVAQPWFSRVRVLYLEGWDAATTVAAQALSRTPHASRLEFLVLSRAEAETLEALSGSETLTGLRSLSLTGSEDQGDEAAAALASTRLTLSRLYLTATGLSDEGVETLARSKALRSLELLALNRNPISDEGAQRLASSKTLVDLRRLELENTELTVEGALAFRSPKALPGLRQLLLRGLCLGRSEMAALDKRLGKGLKL